MRLSPKVTNQITCRSGRRRSEREGRSSVQPPSPSPPRCCVEMQSIPPVLHETYRSDASTDNRSAYSLVTVHDEPLQTPTQRTALLSSAADDHHHSYGAAAPSQPSTRRLLVNATLKMAVIFFVSTAFLGVTLWLALPTLEE